MNSTNTRGDKSGTNDDASDGGASYDNSCSQAGPWSDDPQSESESPETSEDNEEDFRRIMTPPGTPDLHSPTDSGAEDCSDEGDEGCNEELENIDPILRPVKRLRCVNVHRFQCGQKHLLSFTEREEGLLESPGECTARYRGSLFDLAK